MICRVPQFSLCARYNCSILKLRYVAYARDWHVTSLEVILLAPGHLCALLLQVEKADHALLASVSEPTVISEPLDVLDLAAMALALLAGWALQSVKVVDVSVAVMTDSEQMTAMCK